MKDWRKYPEPSGMMGISNSMIDNASSANHGEGQVPQYRRSFALRSLADMSRRVIIQKIHLYHSFGNTPFPLVRAILEQCSAKKLWSMEEESPHYIQHTNYIWRRHCMRDHKDVQSAFAHTDTADDAIDWRELYRMKAVEDYEAKQAATQRIKEKYAALRADKEASQVRIVAGLPADVRKPRSSFAAVSPTAAKATQGQRMMFKARKQAHVLTRAAHAPRSGELTKPPPPPPPPKSSIQRGGGTPSSAASQPIFRSSPQHSRTSSTANTSSLPFDFARKRDHQRHGTES